VAQWTRTAPPRGIAATAVQQVLTSIDRRTTIGRRDYAILLVLARLGLRAGEVVRLDLEDLDWRSGHVRVRGKGGTVAMLPLPADVGAALAAYLRLRHSSHSSRRVFVRVRAPLGGFVGPQAIVSIVRHRLTRAGVTAPTMGAHQFRHALATQMLRQGASLTEIGEVLRHRSPQTTAIYTAVDLTALRTLALPWPGGAR
jgi:site-specific recombinase XerD